MLPAFFFHTRRTRARLGASALVALLGLVLAGGALAEETLPATTTGAGSVGAYLADHQDDFAPFFVRNGAALVSDAFHRAFALGGEALLVILIATWALDIVLARGCSILLAPTQANLRRALFYASGRLVLGLLMSAILVRDLISCLTLMGAGPTTLVVMTLLGISAWVVQVVWFHYVYRCTLPNAVAFYLGLLVIHAIAIVTIVPIFLSPQVDRSITAYVDGSLAPRLRAEAATVRSETDPNLGAVQSEAAALAARVNAAQAEQQSLEQAIAYRKNSADYIYGGLVKLRARGDLTGARAQLDAFLRQFTSGPTAAAARGQLDGIDQELAAQAAAKKQQEADAARAAAQARANLLARAAAGQVTLSEMRMALIGKSRAEVSALFGAPTDTASNRWGYGQHMIFNPQDETHLGLTVNFSDGVVQGVDYYYGSAP